MILNSFYDTICAFCFDNFRLPWFRCAHDFIFLIYNSATLVETSKKLGVISMTRMSPRVYQIIDFKLPPEILADSSNIALKKSVYYPCSISWENDNVITDGSTKSTNYKLIESTCKEKSLVRFNIILSVVKHVGSVTVYSGDCSDCGT